jgi:hypothetical protein
MNLTRHLSFVHNLCMRLWIVELAPVSHGGRRLTPPPSVPRAESAYPGRRLNAGGSVPGGIGPPGERIDHGAGQIGRLFHHD